MKITQNGVDFGSSAWGIGAPTGDGTMSWGLDEA